MLRGSIWDQALEETEIDMLKIDVVAGTGGLLSHAPDRIQSMQILNDAWQPEGVTWMFQDSVFMMPHLGVLSTVYRDAAWNIFDKDCLVRLGTIVAPHGAAQTGSEIFKISMEMPDGSTLEESVMGGEIKRIMIPEAVTVKATIQPGRSLDMGMERGQEVEAEVMGGVGGIILDGRGRPLELPMDAGERVKVLREWFTALKMYPEDMVGKLY
jgi:hypothetical protein